MLSHATHHIQARNVQSAYITLQHGMSRRIHAQPRPHITFQHGMSRAHTSHSSTECPERIHHIPARNVQSEYMLSHATHHIQAYPRITFKHRMSTAQLAQRAYPAVTRAPLQPSTTRRPHSSSPSPC